MFNSTRVTREQQHQMNATATILGIDINHKETTISEIYESVLAVSPSEDWLPATEVLKLVTTVLEKSLLLQQFTFESFMYMRKDFSHWTGLSSLKEFTHLFLFPLYQKYKSIDFSLAQLPKSSIPICDRILWLFMYMWTDYSFQCLYQVLKISGTIRNLSMNSFRKLIRKTAEHLSLSIQDKIQLPSFAEWKARNTGAGMEAYNEIDKTLLLVLDGTSIELYKPSLHSAARGWYVPYKKHHAWRVFVATTTDGTICYLSPLYLGVEDDTKIYHKSGLKDILEQTYSLSEIPDDYKLALAGDKGYIFAVPPGGWEIYLTKSAEKEVGGSEQTERPSDGDPQNRLGYTRKMETALARPRAVIERTILLLKRWKKLNSGHLYAKGGDIFLAHLLTISAVYANYLISQFLLEDDSVDGNASSDSQLSSEISSSDTDNDEEGK